MTYDIRLKGLKVSTLKALFLLMFLATAFLPLAFAIPKGKYNVTISSGDYSLSVDRLYFYRGTQFVEGYGPFLGDFEPNQVRTLGPYEVPAEWDNVRFIFSSGVHVGWSFDIDPVQLGKKYTFISNGWPLNDPLPTDPEGDATLFMRQAGGVGGIWVPVDKLGLLASYIGLASTIVVATVATAIYVKRVKRRKENQ